MVIFQDANWEAKKSPSGKVLVLDRIPYPELGSLSQFGMDLLPELENATGDKTALLSISKKLRLQLRQVLADGNKRADEEADAQMDEDNSGLVDIERVSERLWRRKMDAVLACWRALEIQYLEKNISMRRAVVSSHKHKLLL